MLCFCCYYSILSTVLGEGTFIPLWWIGLLGLGSCAFLPHLCINQNPQNFKNLQKLISTMCLFLLAKKDKLNLLGHLNIFPFLLWDKYSNSMFFLAQKITTLFWPFD